MKKKTLISNYKIMVWNPEIWVGSIFDEESRDFQISRFVDESRFARQRKIQRGASVNT
jgi:hypothetical protein